MVAELILIRHGQSASNVAFPRANAAGLVESGLTGRDTDVELTGLGVRQAQAVGRWLAALPADLVPQVAITSPYLRARETWRIAAETSGLELPPPRTDDRLVDRLLGDLEMLTEAAIRERFPDEPGRHREAGDFRYRPPNGETFSDIAVRLESFLADLNTTWAGRRVVVVAHDSVVLMMRAVIEHLDLDAVAAINQAGSVPNASITRFDGSSGELVLDRYTSVDHLSEV
ncbi:putative phosphoglycerate mutase 2 protein [Actinoplanes sp. N902-109]|nr:putative phosphoglycerate mutase 2 protein [Actinoplanes sp. N902-109]